jgi:UDP-N-acetylmuramate dehydrogenase
MDIEKLLPGVKKNILLKDCTTFKIGGPAKYFFEAKTKEDIIKSIIVAKQLKLPFFVLGNGSNILASDRGYKGLIIRIKNYELGIKSNKIIAGAGVTLGQAVNIATKNNLSGLEWAIGIPGTIGGAAWGNAGAFKKSMQDIVSNVEVLDIKKSEIVVFKNKDCKFNYRSSIFKQKKNLIILSAEIILQKSSRTKIKNKIKEYSNCRSKNQPLNFPSAGSVFKNPCLPAGRQTKVSAGKLIEDCGLKGKIIGGAKISEKHANFIVNFKNAKASDVKKLIKLAKNKVKNKFSTILKEEIVILR